MDPILDSEPQPEERNSKATQRLASISFGLTLFWIAMLIYSFNSRFRSDRTLDIVISIVFLGILLISLIGFIRGVTAMRRKETNTSTFIISFIWLTLWMFILVCVLIAVVLVFSVGFPER